MLLSETTVTRRRKIWHLSDSVFGALDVLGMGSVSSDRSLVLMGAMMIDEMER